MEKKCLVECGEGWKPLYQPIIDEIIAYDVKQSDFYKKIGINKIKEKFGYLDIDVVHPLNVSSTLHGKINTARLRSDKICEFCGTTENVGHSINGFRKVCCESCFDKHVHPNNMYSIWSTECKYNLMR